jgi:glucose uptake protein GlcU
MAALACSVNEIYTDLGCMPNDPIGFTQKFYPIGLGFIAGLSLLVLILGGYRILTSQGDPTKINEGKSYIFYAITGLVLAIFGFVFIQVVVVDLLHIPGFN